MAPVRLGSDVLLASARLRGLRVGVVCNHASIDRGFRHVVDRLSEAEGVTLGAIFGPQHGFRSDVQDNMVETPHGDDQARRVPVYSLYSETREPTADMLRGLDALVIDLQDIGARIYTYIYTNRDMDEQNMQDFDGAPVHMLRMNFFNDWEQTSHEFRVTSQFSDRVQFKIGRAHV